MQCLIVDDHPLTYYGVSHSVTQSNPGMVIVMKDTVEEALREIDRMAAISADEPMFVITDMNFPVGSGMDILRYLREGQFPASAIVVSSSEDSRLIAECKDLGARAYIMKKEALNCVGLAISEMRAGREYVSTAETACREHPFMRVVDTLSEKKLDFLDLVLGGLSNAELGSELNIKTSVAANYVSLLLQKFDVTNRVQILAQSRLAGYEPRRITSQPK